MSEEERYYRIPLFSLYPTGPESRCYDYPMGRLVRVLLVLMLIVTATTACGPRNYSLPKSWPVKQLTLPVGSTVPFRPIAMHEMAANWTDKDWQVYFDCPTANTASVVSHIEACLAPLGYNEFWTVNPRIGSSRKYEHRYYSSDQLTSVTLTEGVKSLGGQTSTPYATEFILMVKVTTRPDRILISAGKTADNGVEFHLEPIQ